MEKIIIAQYEDIDNITDLRVEQQIEDWENTLGKNFKNYASVFSEITKKHLLLKLNKSIFFSMMYIDDFPVAMCALEELDDLPQITVCSDDNGRHGCIVSVYTKVAYRGNGYQQKLIKLLLDFAKQKGFSDITLTTNTPYAKHIYEKAGFRYISNKYFLSL